MYKIIRYLCDEETLFAVIPGLDTTSLAVLVNSTPQPGF